MFIGHLFVFLFFMIASSCPLGMFLLDSFIQQLFVDYLECAGHYASHGSLLIDKYEC